MNLRILLLLAGLLLPLACAGPAPAEAELLTAAWQALEPHTASHDRANWQTVELRQVTGREVAKTFETEGAGCWGPTPPANASLTPAATYWYVHFQPRPATAPPPTGTPSPTAPPRIPEPFHRLAFFLLDQNGRVVARNLSCVIY